MKDSTSVTPNDHEPHLTFNETIRRLNISASLANRLKAGGEFVPAVVYSARCHRYRAADVEAWAEARLRGHAKGKGAARG